MFQGPNFVPKPQLPQEAHVISSNLTQNPIPVRKILKSEIGSSRKLLQQYKNQNSLSQEQFEASIGLILGDASLQTQNQGKTYRLKFEVGEKNTEYLNHIKQLLDPFIFSEPNEIVRINKNNKKVKTFQLQTISHEDFTNLATVFLDANGKKSIKPELLTPVLTPRSLGYWFMDDGGKLDYGPNQGKGIVFNTQNFDFSEVENLCEILEKKFALKAWPKKNKGKFIVAVSGKDYEKVIEILDSYIIPSMKHKLPSPRKS